MPSCLKRYRALAQNHFVTFFRRTIQTTCLLALVTLTASAQPPQQVASPTFDLVSIRPADPMRTVEIAGTTARVPGGGKACVYLPSRVTCRLSLWSLLREAFQVREFEITAPQWTKDDMFDLQAIMPLDTPKATARLMLQNALKERFGLQYHLDHRMTPVYALVPTPDGPKLTEPDPDRPQTRTRDTPSGKIKYNTVVSAGQFFYAGATLDILASGLQSVADLDRPVINETGLTGKYLIDLRWKSSADPDEIIHVIDKGILRATEEQLGLKLVKKDTLLDYLAIDQANRTPTEN